MKLSNTFENVFKLNKKQVVFISFVALLITIGILINNVIKGMYPGYQNWILFNQPETDLPFIIGFLISAKSFYFFLLGHPIHEYAFSIVLPLGIFASKYREIIKNKSGFVIITVTLISSVITILHFISNRHFDGYGYWSNPLLNYSLLLLSVPPLLYLSLLIVMHILLLYGHDQTMIKKNLHEYKYFILLAGIATIALLFIVEVYIYPILPFDTFYYTGSSTIVLVFTVYLFISFMRDKILGVDFRPFNNKDQYFLVLFAVLLPTATNGICFMFLEGNANTPLIESIIYFFVANYVKIFTGAFLTLLILNNVSIGHDA